MFRYLSERAGYREKKLKTRSAYHYAFKIIYELYKQVKLDKIKMFKMKRNEPSLKSFQTKSWMMTYYEI